LAAYGDISLAKIQLQISTIIIFTSLKSIVDNKNYNFNYSENVIVDIKN